MLEVEVLQFLFWQTETVIRMLMNATEHISLRVESHKHGHMGLEDAQTLLRVLCHKKDREASRFLKQQYELPMSSGIFPFNVTVWYFLLNVFF